PPPAGGSAPPPADGNGRSRMGLGFHLGIGRRESVGSVAAGCGLMQFRMEIAIAIAGWLRRGQEPGGRIADPVHREHGTYADGFAALTLGLLALRTGAQQWTEACRRSLEVARQRPSDSEFDQLARLLLAAETEKARCHRLPAGLPVPDAREGKL